MKLTKKRLVIASALTLALAVSGILGWKNFKSNNSDYSPKERKQTGTYLIGLINDVHGHRSKKLNYNLNPKSEKPLKYFVKKMNTEVRPDFTIENGDFIEGTFNTEQESADDFRALDKIYNQLKMPHYHVIGNHDTRGINQDQWKELSHNTSAYYCFDYEKLKVFVLNANDEDRERTTDGFTYYYFSEKQFNWLEENLKKTEDKIKLVFLHHSPFDSQYTGEDGKRIFPEHSERLKKLFSQYGVKAVFSGHLEKLLYDKIDEVEYFVLPGFYKSENDKIRLCEVFSLIFITDEKIWVKMFYKNNSEDEYRNLIIPSSESEEFSSQYD